MSSRAIWTHGWVVLVLIAQPAQAMGGQGLVDEVRAANQTSIDSIRSLTCKVTKATPVSKGRAASVISARYWGADDSSRMEIAANSQLSHSVLHDGIGRSLSIGRDRSGQEIRRFSILKSNPDERHGSLDVPSLALLKLIGPKGYPLTLNDLLESETTVRNAARVSESGSEFVVLSVSVHYAPEKSGEWEIWLDPQVNYLVSKLLGSWKDDNSEDAMRRESLVTRFKEARPTVFFPEQVETKFFSGDKLIQHDITDFSDIVVNEPLPDQIFELPIPPNAEVTDLILNREYKVDSTGKPIGGFQVPAAFPPLPAGQSARETAVEPVSMIRWILPASAMILAIAASIWLFRKFRTGLESTTR